MIFIAPALWCEMFPVQWTSSALFPDEGGAVQGDAGAGDAFEAFLPLEGGEGMELDPLTDEHICRQQVRRLTWRVRP